ncbi:MAG: hypothetical protein IJ233_03810, partial [Pyramidobacter sp.]|nr:hypothetical protein [Pyramidobacter sp.]
MDVHTDASPLGLTCKNCGAPAEFDIVRQTYRCPSCGSERSIEDFPAEVRLWTQKNRRARSGSAAEFPKVELSCPKCAARIVMERSEGSAKCPFCGTSLIRRDFVEQADFPELIIPFFLTLDEAKARLREWAAQNSRKKEAKDVMWALDRLEGFYLPYQLVKGPVSARVTRDSSSRAYECGGCMNGLAVNVSSQMDNAVLDAAEPFDWSGLRGFEYGFAAGQKIKLADMKAAAADLRAAKEVEETFAPAVMRAMQTTGVNVRVSLHDAVSVPALLPMYVLRRGNVAAAVNGQTGRVAVSRAKAKKTYPWLIEPTLLTLAVALAFWLGFRSPELAFYGGAVFGLIFFTVFSEGRGARVRSVIFRGRTSDMARAGTLVSGAKKEQLVSGPVFFEEIDGVKKPVRLHFYTPMRVILALLGTFAVVFLPALAAWIVTAVRVAFGAPRTLLSAL